ncbi:MAG: type II toxin-antitoxin system RelE/ParE family toxin [Nanoarchaeota archaeon]|nr:type II toxin-antitoxin system RelE/ParE family toxin [Nanoarchaeota archaeon]
MMKITFTAEFKSVFFGIKDNLLKKRILKQIEKIRANSEVGKPMRYGRKGIRELYVKPFRLSYEFFKELDCIYILKLYHKKKQ